LDFVARPAGLAAAFFGRERLAEAAFAGRFGAAVFPAALFDAGRLLPAGACDAPRAAGAAVTGRLAGRLGAGAL
jgi:hypothetical protein